MQTEARKCKWTLAQRPCHRQNIASLRQDSMRDQEFVVTSNQVKQIEGLLPFLYNVEGRGETDAKDAAEALMAMLDLVTAVVGVGPTPTNTDSPTADVPAFRRRGGN